ncbi:MAG: hypothetical protein HY509_05605 [Acidobacteria bacterium]|nr:hypothetical protein [Acidobacteriota bacterium]
MRRTGILGVLTLATATAAALAGGNDRWLHVRVDSGGEDGEKVRVNLPLSLVENILPHIEVEGFKAGKIRLGELENGDLGKIDLRAILEEVRKAPDAEFVTVDGPEEKVRVSKSGGRLLVQVEDREGGEKVNAQFPLAVVDAMLAGEPDEIDVIAGIRALGDHVDGDLVLVESDEETVRVWIDGRSSM